MPCEYMYNMYKKCPVERVTVSEVKLLAEDYRRYICSEALHKQCPIYRSLETGSLEERTSRDKILLESKGLS